MANQKTSKKPTKQPTKSTKKLEIGGMKFERHSPTAALRAMSYADLGEALGQAFADADKEAFQEILEGFVRARSISSLTSKQLSRSSIYESFDPRKNPSIGTVMKVIKAVKDQEKKTA